MNATKADARGRCVTQLCARTHKGASQEDDQMVTDGANDVH